MRSSHQAQKMTVRNDRVRRKAELGEIWVTEASKPDLARFISLSPTAIPSRASCVYEWRRPGCGLTGPFLEENVSEMPKMFAAYNVLPRCPRLLSSGLTQTDRKKEDCLWSCVLILLNYYRFDIYTKLFPQLWRAGSVRVPCCYEEQPNQMNWFYYFNIGLHCNPERRTEKLQIDLRNRLKGYVIV